MRVGGTVTRADVARLAGVSPSVVSFALNGGPRPVAFETAQRVRAAAERLGYVPNAAARALRGGTSGAIGVLVSDFGVPYEHRIATSVQRAAVGHPVGAMVTSTLGSAEYTLPMLKHLAASQVDGIVLTARLEPGAVDDAERLATRIVQVARGPRVPGATRLVPDAAAGAHKAIDHLVALGHTSIAFCGERAPDDDAIRVWEESHRARGVAEGMFIDIEPTLDGAYAGMQRVLQHHVPTAVIVGGCTISVGVLRAIHEDGLHVPRDISLIALDDSAALPFVTPPVTALQVPLDRIASDALAAIYADEPYTPFERRYVAELVERDSTAPPRSSLG